MRIIWGDSSQELKKLEDNSVDAVVTDPPYGLSFMGKKWDYDVPSVELWTAVYRVLKPGGHLLSFGGTRTYHRMVCAIEDAGFDIRDQIAWLYGSGFPKSLDVSKAIDKAQGVEREINGLHENAARSLGNGRTMDGGAAKAVVYHTSATSPEAKHWVGWGTALKPANEPIVLARKPLEKGLTVAENVLKWGTGAINVDAGRIGMQEAKTYSAPDIRGNAFNSDVSDKERHIIHAKAQGRWPANVLFDEAAAGWLDEQSGDCKSTGVYKADKLGKEKPTGDILFTQGKRDNNYAGQSGGASRFFYVAKTSKRERNAGLDGYERIDIVTSCTKEEGTAAVQLLQKVISESTVRWLIDESGANISAIYPKECKSTIKTETNKIIESEILSLLIRSLIKENTPAVSVASSHAVNVESLKKFLLNITGGETESALGAVNAASKMLHIISESAEPIEYKSNHPTVKPLKLMEYLCKLITPPNGTILDPFMGSGSTGCAAVKLGYAFIGIEREAEYIEIAKRRIEHWAKETEPVDLDQINQLALPI